MDNARIHLRSKDFKPNGPKYRKAGLLHFAADFSGYPGEDFGDELRGDTQKKAIEFYIGRDGKERGVEAFMVSMTYGDIAARPTPRPPGVESDRALLVADTISTRRKIRRVACS